jgi:uncharacterized protein (DUF2147 family)
LFRVATLAILVFATFAALSPSHAKDLTPVGKWRTATGESQYEVFFCGESKLCAKLTWLRADARTSENTPYLNKYVVKGARQTASNKWNGTVSFAGQRVGGSITMLNNSKMRLKGCQLVFCQSVEFHRL